MTPTQFTMDVPADRRVTLPPEVPVGSVTFTVSEDSEPRNPDTPEFRAMVERSREGLRLYQIWFEERKAIALQSGMTVDSLQFPSHEERRAAFRQWLLTRSDAQALL